MIRLFRFLRKAAADLAAGQRFYERQEPGLGQYFRDNVNAELRSLLILAGTHRVMYGLHRCLIKRFPYAVFYEVKRDTVVIYAILDCRRDPEKLRRRLRGH